MHRRMQGPASSNSAVDTWLTANRGYIFLTLVFLVVLGGVVFALRRPEPQPVVISTPAPRPTATERPSPTPPLLVVQVSGAVVSPGLFRLSEGARVDDAIRAAGGPSPEADTTRLNLARKISDGEQIVVPKLGDPTAIPVATAAGRATNTAPRATPTIGIVNINTASEEELDRLPGIGPALAQRIIDYRQTNGPFQKIEDIMRVRGIGQAEFALLKNLIVVQ
jgi:competence protein ComEA